MQSLPGQAASVLYGPMANLPPRTLITDQSASTNIHFSPNHSASITRAPPTIVSAPSNFELNRLACIQPSTPLSRRGGGNAILCSVLALVDISDP